MPKQQISDATKKNWERLNVSKRGKLSSRANKTQSTKKIIPIEYMKNPSTILFLEDLMKKMELYKWKKEEVLFSIAVSLFQRKGIFSHSNVQRFLKEYPYSLIEEVRKMELPNEIDLLGLFYQSSLLEGVKNKKGSYYTPEMVTHHMLHSLQFSKGQTFLDPCCGSGAFFLALENVSPTQIYGIDNDPIAVMIAKANLILKFPKISFYPQIECFDYLNEKSSWHDLKFDYIITNPPWGAIPNQKKISSSQEYFSCFYYQAYSQLKEKGIIRFLFPYSVMNVKAHKDIRTFMLEHGNLKQITIYDTLFSGVTTSYVDIEVKKEEQGPFVKVIENKKKKKISVDSFYETENRVFNLLEEVDRGIIQKVKKNAKETLKDSLWSIGIVTGNNHEKLLPRKIDDSEKIYTGKEIDAYELKPAKNYLIFNPSELQQVGKEAIYRAPEKLVYKFVSNKLVFAYDSSKSLFLNSANILIPNIPNMSIKTVMGFLNSKLYQYLYIKLFGEIKILKGNLMELPFPLLTKEEDEKVLHWVNRILEKDELAKEELDAFIFQLFALTKKEKDQIEKVVSKK